MSDITYCVAECTNTKCERHSDNIKRWWFMVSLSDFSNDCPYYSAKERRSDNAKDVYSG